MGRTVAAGAGTDRLQVLGATLRRLPFQGLSWTNTEHGIPGWVTSVEGGLYVPSATSEVGSCVVWNTEDSETRQTFQYDCCPRLEWRTGGEENPPDGLSSLVSPVSHSRGAQTRRDHYYY